MNIDTQVPIETPFGTRVLDIVVHDDNGKIIGAVETKLNDSRYLPSQRAKDA